MELTQEYLKARYIYNQETGLFHSKIYRKDGPVGYKSTSGYTKIEMLGKTYAAHRLAFLYINGEFPKMVDHVNGIKTDNRWENLRETTASLNVVNWDRSGSNKSGLPRGVRKIPSGKYRSIIFFKKKAYHLGVFDSIGDAEQAYRSKAEQFYGSHAFHVSR